MARAQVPTPRASIMNALEYYAVETGMTTFYGESAYLFHEGEGNPGTECRFWSTICALCVDVLLQDFGRTFETPSPLPDLYACLALALARRLTCAVFPTLAVCSPVQQGIELELRRSHPVIRLDLMLNGSKIQTANSMLTAHGSFTVLSQHLVMSLAGSCP